MAKLKCKETKSLTGLFIEVSSSDGSTSVCNLSYRSDITHRVEITNLSTYPLDLFCKGKIHAPLKRVKFDSPEPNDTDTDWSASQGSIQKKCLFDHVKLKTVRHGEQQIDTEVEARWPMPGKSNSSTVTIHVDG